MLKLGSLLNRDKDPVARDYISILLFMFADLTFVRLPAIIFLFTGCLITVDSNISFKVGLIEDLLFSNILL